MYVGAMLCSSHITSVCLLIATVCFAVFKGPKIHCHEALCRVKHASKQPDRTIDCSACHYDRACLTCTAAFAPCSIAPSTKPANPLAQSELAVKIHLFSETVAKPLHTSSSQQGGRTSKHREHKSLLPSPEAYWRE